MENSANYNTFKEKLEAELARVKAELLTVGRINPDNPEDWEPTPANMDIMYADRNEAADGIEEFEEHSAILRELEIQYNEIKDALERIADGVYGKCEKDGEDIPHARLEAYPAARTCVEHAEEGEK